MSFQRAFQTPFVAFKVPVTCNACPASLPIPVTAPVLRSIVHLEIEGGEPLTPNIILVSLLERVPIACPNDDFSFFNKFKYDYMLYLKNKTEITVAWGRVMFFKRREFIVSASLMALASLIPNLSKSKVVKLGNSRYCIVAPGTNIELPASPEVGHAVNLVIPRSSLIDPSRIKFSSVPLMGDKEDLLLDSFGHVKLTFLGFKRGWVNLPG